MNYALTRRAALSGAVASVAMVGVTATTAHTLPAAIIEASSVTCWDAALANWKEAQTAYFGLPLDSDQAVEDAAEAREYAAWRALFEMPAPHIGALHWKLHFLFGDEEADGEWDPAITRLVLADAARLAKMEG